MNDAVQAYANIGEYLLDAVTNDKLSDSSHWHKFGPLRFCRSCYTGTREDMVNTQIHS